MRTHLDLFSGIGGFTLAAESVGFKTVAFSEIHPDKCVVLNHYWPDVPNLGDITDEDFIDRARAIGPIDLITAGVPCQPASTLGQMRGAADERWLWPDFIRVVRKIRPRVAVVENPPSVLVLPEFHGVIGEIATLGYDLFWDVIPAAAIGAGHLRERVFIVITDADNPRLQGHAGDETGNGRQEPDGSIAAQDLFGVAPDASCGGRSKGRQRRLVGDSQRASEQTHEMVADSNSIRSKERLSEASTQRRGWKESRLGLNGKMPIPDLRGRVDCEHWWHEAHTGIPVLAPGISGRLAEAVSCCVGDSVVPQVAAIVLEAVVNSFLD